MGFGSRARATTGRRVRRSDDGGEVTVTNRTRARTNAHEKPEHRDAVLDRFYRANGGKKHDCGACEGDAARATNYDSRTRAVTATCDRHPDPKGRSLTRSATFSLQVRHLVCPLGAPPEARPGELSRWRRAGRVAEGRARAVTRKHASFGDGRAGRTFGTSRASRPDEAPVARRGERVAALASRVFLQERVREPLPRERAERAGAGASLNPRRGRRDAQARGVMEEGRAKTRKRRKTDAHAYVCVSVRSFSVLFTPKADSRHQSRPFRLPFSFQPSQNFLARTEPSPAAARAHCASGPRRARGRGSPAPAGLVDALVPAASPTARQASLAWRLSLLPARGARRAVPKAETSEPSQARRDEDEKRLRREKTHAETLLRRTRTTNESVCSFERSSLASRVPNTFSQTEPSRAVTAYKTDTAIARRGSRSASRRNKRGCCFACAERAATWTGS